MIRFVDLGNQEFAWYVPNERRFLTLCGRQSWSCWADFEEDFYDSKGPHDRSQQEVLERCRVAAPESIFNEEMGIAVRIGQSYFATIEEAHRFLQVFGMAEGTCETHLVKLSTSKLEELTETTRRRYEDASRGS